MGVYIYIPYNRPQERNNTYMITSPRFIIEWEKNKFQDNINNFF